MSGTILSILMLAGIALVIGGFVLIVKHRNRKQGILMLVAALVMFGNVAIWAIPGPQTVPAPAAANP
jgi:hypothetical protein